MHVTLDLLEFPDFYCADSILNPHNNEENMIQKKKKTFFPQQFKLGILRTEMYVMKCPEN